MEEDVFRSCPKRQQFRPLNIPGDVVYSGLFLGIAEWNEEGMEGMKG